MKYQPVSDLLSRSGMYEYIQQWHVPVSTTPQNTGMSLGGMGSTCTLNPAGHTASINFKHGLFITGTQDCSIEFAKYFYKESSTIQNGLRVHNSNDFLTFLEATPVYVDGERVKFEKRPSDFEIDDLINKWLEIETFYSDNIQHARNSNVKTSQRTLALAEKSDFRRLNRSFLFDLFPGSISDQKSYSTCLIGGGGTTNWQNNYPLEDMWYCANYPQSTTQYKSGEHACRIQKNHSSPGLCQSSIFSSLPIFWSEFEIINDDCALEYEIGLTQTIEDFTGYEVIKQRGASQDAEFNFTRRLGNSVRKSINFSLAKGKFTGILFQSIDGANQFLFGVYSEDPDIYIHVNEDMLMDQESYVIQSSLFSGVPARYIGSNMNCGKETKGGGLSVNAYLAPKQSKKLRFLAINCFDEVYMQSPLPLKSYRKHFEDIEKSELPIHITKYYIHNRDVIDTELKQSQTALSATSIIQDFTLSISPLKCTQQISEMLLNSYSFLAEGSQWTDQGAMLVRESIDYPFYNSLDVYFYGSFTLLALHPTADKENILLFAKEILNQDLTARRHHRFGYFNQGNVVPSEFIGARKLSGFVPHDLGSVFDPAPNAYCWHNVHHWLDLAPKFVLLTLRAYQSDPDTEFLLKCWDSIEKCLDNIRVNMHEGVNLPITRGTSDTFDNIENSGVTVYSATLWVAALRAVIEIADILDKPNDLDKFKKMEVAATKDLNAWLWDEKEGYYHSCYDPIISTDFKSEYNAELINFLSQYMKIGPSTSAAELVQHLNDFITSDGAFNDATEASNSGLGKKVFRKQLLYTRLPNVWATDSDRSRNDSDSVVAGQLLADTYLMLLGLPPITPKPKRQRALSTMLTASFYRNGVGVCNSCPKDGRQSVQFQANDIWVGVQYSICSALIMSDMYQEFDRLFLSLYKAIYKDVKIPFGIPEGFMIRSGTTLEQIRDELKLDDAELETLEGNLRRHPLVEFGDLIALSETTPNAISGLYENICLTCDGQATLLRLLQQNNIYYTAGRYFRQGMIASIPLAMNFVRQHRAPFDAA